MYAAQGDLPQALQQYDKALSQHANGHPITAITYTNKAMYWPHWANFRKL
jgi:hypothetical protein